MQYDLVLAFYIRLSSEDIDLFKNGKNESFSVVHQRMMLRDYYQTHPELHKYRVIEFVDDGYTGTNFNRPGFHEMLTMIRRKELHCVIVKDLSRMGRDTLEVGAYLELVFPLFGTRFISINDNFDSDNYAGTTGGVDLAFRNLINGLYSKDLSVKVRSAIKTRNRRGHYWGGSAFYGYLTDPRDKHKLLVNSEVSYVVTRIFRECIEGYTNSEIAKRLNDDRIPSPAAYKKQRGQRYNGRVVETEQIWLSTTIRRILIDERYTGKMVSNKRETIGLHSGKMRALPKEEWIIVEGTHEPIITQETFDLAQKALAGRCKNINQNTAGCRENNLFVCAYCGRKLQKSYGREIHLFCGKALVIPDSDCTKLHEPIGYVEQIVLELLRAFACTFTNAAAEKRIAIDYNKKGVVSEIRECESTISKLQSEKLTEYEAYRSGSLSKEAFIKNRGKRQERIDTKQRRLVELNNLLESMTIESNELMLQSQQVQTIDQLKEYDPTVIRKLVKRVLVYGSGKVELDLTVNGSFIERIMEHTNAIFNDEESIYEPSLIPFPSQNQSGKVKIGSKL